MRSLRPFPNNPHLKLRRGYVCTEREPFLQRGDAGNGLGSFAVIQACRKAVVAKQRAAGTRFSLGFLSLGWEKANLRVPRPPASLLQGLPSLRARLGLPVRSQILPVYAHPGGRSCVLPVTLPPGW